MSVLDVFSSDAFGVISLTQAINKLPFRPSRLGAMGLFAQQGVTTTSVMIEEREGLLALLPTRSRGGAGTVGRTPKRKARSFAVPHIPHSDAVMADDVQNVRAFGSESQVETIAGLVNDKLELMRQNHEATHEYHRLGAAKGLILDADGATTIYDLFAEFSLTQSEINFAFANAATEIRTKCLDTKRLVEDALGMATYDHVHGICGADFFDALINHPDTREMYKRWQDGSFLRSDPRAGFEVIPGFVVEEYRGKVSGVDFIDSALAYFFPVGVPNLFVTHFAPANYIETVNTVGLPIYAKQERMKFDKGIELETQSNPLCMCVRPQCLIKGVMA